MDERKKFLERKRRRAKVALMARTGKTKLISSFVPKDDWTCSAKQTLRNKSNAAEEHIHKILRTLNLSFDRERPLVANGNKYFIDFLVVSVFLKDGTRKKVRVAIEVDGGYHFTEKQQATDRKKDADLLTSCRVYSVLRIGSKMALSMDADILMTAIVKMKSGSVKLLY